MKEQLSCSSEYFSTKFLRIQYSKVCGRVIGYQNGSADTFALRESPSGIDDGYVDGISVTHGMPLQSHLDICNWCIRSNCCQLHALPTVHVLIQL